MSYNIRRVQNKQKKETNEIRNSELQLLRQENQRLKKINKRLRKNLEKFATFEPIEETTSLAEVEGPTASNSCPQCQSNNISIVDLGLKRLSVCKNCLWRKTV